MTGHGLVDLTRAGPGDNYVRFVSKTLISIEIGVRRTTVSRRDDACTQKPVRLPTCRLAMLVEAFASWTLDDWARRIDAIPGMPVKIGATTTVRYVAGEHTGRWILSGLASDEVDDDFENSDTDKP